MFPTIDPKSYENVGTNDKIVIIQKIFYFYFWPVFM